MESSNFQTKSDKLPQSSHINEKWLDNVFENIKNIENFERLAREGCASVYEYVVTPQDTIAGIQYKNLKLIANEIKLLLPDIVPIVDDKKIDVIQKQLDIVCKLINERKRFVNEPESEVSKRLLSSKVTPYFYETLENLHKIRKEIVKLLRYVFYIKPLDYNVGVQR